VGVSPAPGDLLLDLTAQEGKVSILDGPQTHVWQYVANLQSGDPTAVQPMPASYLGPLLRLRRGQRLQVRFHNDLPDPSIIHWHGLHVPDAADGHPRFAVSSGGSYDYDFTIANRAGTYWFHPHPHMLTGPQVYFGLAGLIIVSDDEEAALGLPGSRPGEGAFDLPLVIQDRSFDSQNNLLYQPNGVMDQMTGMLGDRILVNGLPDYTLEAYPAVYRLRLLNGSNSRIYKLAWSDQTPLTVIATDGGLLAEPVLRDFITLAPSERIELWADFSNYQPGQEIRLLSLEFPIVSEGGMGGMMGGVSAALPNGAAFDVLRLKIAAGDGPRPSLPARLSDMPRLSPKDAHNVDRPRRFELAMQMMTGTINGRTFEMEAVAADEIVRLGDTEIWQFANLGSGMGGMMGAESIPHPMHIHGLQFQIIERQIPRTALARALSPGYVDEGWKDSLLVLPGEQAKVLLRFEDFTGLYLYHCHNLEHEDGGMMRNYRIEAISSG
jgi:hypothetical protein